MRYLTMVKLPQQGRPDTWSNNDKEEFIKNNGQVIRLAKEILAKEENSNNIIIKKLVSDLKEFAHTYEKII